MSDAMTVPHWDQTTVRIAARSGDREVPALTHPLVPGLAVTMADFGVFRVTHIRSGLAIGGTYTRAGNAVHECAQWGAIARAIGLAWADADADAVREAINAALDAPVPFTGATSTSQGETRPLTIRQWVSITRSVIGADEFPWESDEDDPWTRAMDILVRFADAPAAPRGPTEEAHRE